MKRVVVWVPLAFGLACGTADEPTSATATRNGTNAADTPTPTAMAVAVPNAPSTPNTNAPAASPTEAPARPTITPEQRRELRAAIREGRAKTRVRDHVAALADFRRALAIDGTSARLRCEAGFVAFRAGELDEAERWIQLALGRLPNDPPEALKVPVAMCLFNAGLVYEAKGRKAEAPPPTTLESLYDRLARAKDGPEASAIVKQIERRWMRSGSETADLLLVRAGQAAAAKDNETALELFDFMIMLRPQWAEAYHRRATLLFSMNDHDGALRDIQATLTRDPRHFSALAGLGMIMQQVDNKKAAYRAFTRALELNPHMTNLKEMVEKLKPEIEGQPL